jgi:hypothetical protein
VYLCIEEKAEKESRE